MAITKSFNKHNQTYYVYDTSYVWDEAKQKKVQKRRCIGKWDPVTEKIIPTGKRGRPNELDAKLAQSEVAHGNPAEDSIDLQRVKVFNSIATNLKVLQSVLSNLASDIQTASEYFTHEPLPIQSTSDNEKRDEHGKAETL